MRGGEGRPIRVQVKLSLSYNKSMLKDLVLDIQTPFNVVCDTPKIMLEALSFGSGTPYT